MFYRDPDPYTLFLICHLLWMFKMHFKFHMAKIELVILFQKFTFSQTFSISLNDTTIHLVA